VRRRRNGVECALCGETLTAIKPTSKVRVVLVGMSGQENMRAVIADGTEVHRCPALGPPTGAVSSSV
jgi:hypothetical protein